MQIRDFRFEDYPALAAIHNSQGIVWPEQPHTPDAWLELDRNRSSKSIFLRWVAEEDGRVVGFASSAQNPWNYPPQSFYINVEVLPEYQCRGIGAALYKQIMIIGCSKIAQPFKMRPCRPCSTNWVLRALPNGSNARRILNNAPQIG